MRETKNLFVASLKMLYRDQESLMFAAVSPLIMVAILALFTDLSFGAGGVTFDFFDFVVTGLAAFWVVYFAIYAVSAAVAGYRAEGILKRISASPASPAKFIAAQVLSRVLVGIVQVTAMLLLGAALGADIELGAGLVWVIALAALGTLIALNIGFAIAGVTKTQESAASFASLLVMPLWILSGVMFPIQAFPGFVQRAVEYLPVTPLIESIRGVALEGTSITSYGTEILLLAGWLVVSFLIAARTFRFTEREAPVPAK